MSEKPSDDRARASAKRSGNSPSRLSPGREASIEANRRAAAILEVLGGLRTPAEAAEILKISVAHYYVLERKALRGLISECEPQPKGRRGPSAEQELLKLRRELEQCRRECLRQAALVRATQRAVGLPALSPAPSGGRGPKAGKRGAGAKGGKRRRRATVRALRAADVLRKNSSGVDAGDAVEQSSPDQATDDPSRPTHEEQHGGTQG
jgi:hypothetical protein